MVDVTKIPGLGSSAPASNSTRTQSTQSDRAQERRENIKANASERADSVSLSDEARALNEAEDSARQIRNQLEFSKKSLSPPGSLTDFAA
jgi:hypothetical protein